MFRRCGQFGMDGSVRAMGSAAATAAARTLASCNIVGRENISAVPDNAGFVGRIALARRTAASGNASLPNGPRQCRICRLPRFWQCRSGGTLRRPTPSGCPRRLYRSRLFGPGLLFGECLQLRLRAGGPRDVGARSGARPTSDGVDVFVGRRTSLVDTGGLALLLTTTATTTGTAREKHLRDDSSNGKHKKSNDEGKSTGGEG